MEFDLIEAIRARVDVMRRDVALGIGDGRIPALVACGLAFVAGICSLARLNPAVRRPPDAVAGEPAE